MSDVEDVDMDVDAEEIMEMSTEKLDEINARKKKNILLNEVHVTGLLKNINEKVSNKLDNDAQNELVDIINEKVKDGYEGGLIDLESEVEKAISFDEGPTDDHIINTANKNRVTPPANRRLPTKESKLSLSDIQEQANVTKRIDSVDEEFENLFKNEDEFEHNKAMVYDKKDMAENSTDSYIDDFDALLKEDTAVLIEIDTDFKCDVDADFDALLIEENLEILTLNNNAENSVLNGKLSTSLSETKIEPEQCGARENSLKESNFNSSMDDIFQELEKNENDLLEKEILFEKGLLDESDILEDVTEINTKQMKDPFDDLFDELDETNLENIDQGFQQIYENKKDNYNPKGITISSSNVEESQDVNAETEKVTVHGMIHEISETQEQEQTTSQCITDTKQDLFQNANIVGIQIGEDDHVKQQEVIQNIGQGTEVEVEFQDLEHESVSKFESTSVQGDPNNVLDKSKFEQEITRKEVEMKNEREGFMKKIEQLENQKEKLKTEIKLLSEKQEVVQINKSGKKVIIPTVNHDPNKLDEEIRNDTREAELLIQLKHLSERVVAQDTLLAETKEDNTVLKIQNRSLLESINNSNESKSKTKKKSMNTPSLDWHDGNDSCEKKRLFLLEHELEDQKEVNKQLKAYIGDILINIIVQNPQMLEKKQ